jgi:hypothetical protein
LCVECEKPRVRILKIQAGEVRSHGCKESVWGECLYMWV